MTRLCGVVWCGVVCIVLNKGKKEEGEGEGEGRIDGRSEGV